MKQTVFIAAGGTGGHLYPALAVADALKNLEPQIDIHFVGSPYGLEVKILPKYNYPFHLIPVGGLNQTSFLNKLLVLLKFPVAFTKALFLLLKYNPQFVFGFGGYASGPTVMLASLMRKKTALFESNAIPGKTNRILSYFVRTSFVTFESAKKFLKSKNVIEIGFPVRADMNPAQATPSSRFRVLVFGGSQGARGINMTVSQAVADGGDWLSGVELVHQTGRFDFTTIKNLYESKHEYMQNVKVLEYLDPIKNYYDWADFIVCRAGASTIAELAACGKAALLIPFPFAADNHQQKNAESLVEQSAALMCIQKEFTPDFFKKTIVKFKNSAHLQDIKKLETSIHKLHKADAAKKMAQFVLDAKRDN